MRGSIGLRLGLGVGALGLGLSGLWAQGSGSVDVSSYPPDVQKQYKICAEKCSRCHDLSRPLAAKYTAEAQWRGMVRRMAQKPGASISPKDQDQITAFLVYYQQARAGTAPSVGTNDSTPPPPAAASVVPEPGTGAPAPPPGSTPSPTTSPGAPVVAPSDVGTAAGGGLRVEVEALPAQPVGVPWDGRWSTTAPGPGENMFLSVRLFDAATGEKVPYATVRARVGSDSAPAKTLQPLFGAKGFQYGANFAAPAGDLAVSLEVEPPSLARVNDDGSHWMSPLNLKLTLHGR